MNTAQLECFVSLASTLNFVKTADQLGLTQPAITKQLKSIESELGASLFQRTSRSVSLTPVGEAFLPEAEAMLNIFYRSRSWIKSYSGSSHAPLRIGYSEPLLMQVLSQIMKNYVNHWPELEFAPELVCDQTDANLSRLQKGQLDCVLSMRDSSFDDADIIFSPFMSCGFLCGVAKSHPLAARYLENPDLPKEIMRDDFWPYRQIVSIPPYLLKKFFSRGHQIIPVNDQVSNIFCENENESLALLMTGVAYSLIPEYLCIDHPDILFLKWPESKRSRFGVYYRKEPKQNESLSRFIQTAKDYYRNWESNHS